MCVCSCCGTKSSATTWAKYENNARAKQPVAVEDRCRDCVDRYKARGYDKYMSFTEFGDHKKSDDGKREGAQISASKVHPELRPFEVETVVQGRVAGSGVSRHFSIMTEAEFTNKFGRPHNKMPACPMMTIQREGGAGTESVYLFEHPVFKGRTLEIFSIHDMKRHTTIMGEACHYHEKQGEKSFEHQAD